MSCRSSYDSPPADEDVLRIGTIDNIQSANILLDSTLAALAQISNPPLMRMDKHKFPQGRLVVDPLISPDAKTFRFDLRDDLFWSDGIPVTAGDVVFTLRYLRDFYPAAGWMKSMISEISISSEGTIEVNLTRPYGRLDFELTSYKLLPKHVWSKIPDPMHYTNPDANVGCGPFVIQSLDLNQGVLTFIRNPYWKGKIPALEKIEVHIFKNMDVLALALEKGDVDIFYGYASSYPYSGLARLESSGRFDFIRTMNTGLAFLAWNLKHPPMQDLRFRRAVSYAINYPEILKLILLGYGKVPSAGFVPEIMPHYKPENPLEYDPARAAALLRDAGYRDEDGNGIREDLQGKDLELSLLVNTEWNGSLRLAELLQDYFRKAGIRIQIRTADGSTWVSLKDRYQYDLILARSSPWGMMMHANWGTGYFDARRTGEGVLHILEDPEFQKLCDAALASSDPGELSLLAHQIQAYYSKNLPAIPLYWHDILIPYNRRFSGWTFDPIYGYYNLESFLNLERQGN